MLLRSTTPKLSVRHLKMLLLFIIAFIDLLFKFCFLRCEICGKLDAIIPETSQDVNTAL